MTREEQLAKLKTVQLCVCNLTATYDMGLQFDIITEVGAETNMGNINQWPCFEFNVTESIREIQKAIRNKIVLSDETLLEDRIIKEICTNHDLYLGSYKIEGDNLSKALQLIKEELHHVDLSNDKIYAYATIDSWNMCIKFFSELDDLKMFFKESNEPWTLYKDMSDDEVKGWYEIAEENEWDSFALYRCDKN